MLQVLLRAHPRQLLVQIQTKQSKPLHYIRVDRRPSLGEKNIQELMMNIKKLCEDM